MHKNIRRSIAVAATATGMWALGTAAASADEVSVSVPLSSPDTAADAVEDVKDVDVRVDVDAVEDVKGVASGVQDKTAGTAGQAESAAYGAVQDVQQHDVRGIAEQTRQYAEAELPSYDVPAAPGLPTAPDAADVQSEIDYLFGPLAAFAHELGQVPGQTQGYAGQTQAGAQAAVQQAPGYAHGYAYGAVDAATPVVHGAAQDVLPPIAARAVNGLVPVAGQAVGDAGGLAQGVAGDVTPFAGGVVSDVQPLAYGVVSEAGPFAGGVVGAVQPFVETVVEHVQPVAYGVGGSAGTLAHGVAGDVTPFAGGVVSDVQPFAQDLSGTLASAPLAGNAVHGAQGAASAVTPGYASHLTQGI
jgi:hypothetical protein